MHHGGEKGLTSNLIIKVEGRGLLTATMVEEEGFAGELYSTSFFTCLLIPVSQV